MPYPYPYGADGHRGYQDDYSEHYYYHDDDHCRAPKRRDCDIWTPLASGSLRTRGDWVCIDLPRHIAGARPLTLTIVAAECVSSAAIDPSCVSCRSESGMALRVTIPLSLTLVDCRGYQHAACSSIDVCVPITQCTCARLPKNARVNVKACVSLVEPVCINECERYVEALLDMRIDACVVGMLPRHDPCDICPLPLPWYPQPPRIGARGDCCCD
ncbi:MAG: hypothetical protein LBK46_10540 [Oscillospiraceae bacterium]|nr:hypothetical protein [Oscillospiraceae bacterium]